MNTIHNNGENDQTLDSDLDELDQTYSKLEQDEPPELLDQAILNSAHRAVEKKPHWMKFGWLHGLTTTAVFLLAFTIILDQRESAPAMTSPATPPVEMSELRERVQAPQQARRDLRVQGAALGKSEQDDKDQLRTENLHEESMIDEAESMADAPAAADAVIMQNTPTAASAPDSSTLKSREGMDTAIEKELQAIIDLKNADDESWITKLEAFIERYPDYPLPDELKD